MTSAEGLNKLTSPIDTPKAYRLKQKAICANEEREMGNTNRMNFVEQGLHQQIHVVSKANINKKYAELADRLGQPTSDVIEDHSHPAVLSAYSLIQTFEHGMITDAFSTHAVYGAIYQKYVELGREKGFLGYPSTDETGTPDGKGRFNHFKRSSIYWTAETGAHEVHGAIHKKWKSLGWERSFLGYPITDEMTTPDGRGRYNHFQGGSIYWTPETGAQEVHGAIHDKWAALGYETGFLGYPITSEQAPDERGRFNHFQGGSIYWTPQTGAHEVHGAIRDKWESMGWERSFLGYPTSDEVLFAEDGRASAFEHGGIYWWPDLGAIELRDVIVHYTGLVCFGETDWDGPLNDADEPYVILGTVTPSRSSTVSSQIYNDVDGGESRPDLLELYRGKPDGVNISVLLMEHDEGDPDKYKAAVEFGVKTAAKGVAKGIAYIPVVGPFLAPVAESVLPEVVPVIAEELNKAFDFGDDRIGSTTLHITAKQMVVLAARTPNLVERGVGFKVVTDLLSGDGASYKVYFGLVPA